MIKYFILNFLSFESTNALHALFNLRRACGVHAPFFINDVSNAAVFSGYTVSYSYKKLREKFPKSIFILIKETPENITNHLLYGYYQKLYDNNVLKDFDKYFNIHFQNDEIKLLADTYYSEVESFFKDNLVVMDLSGGEGTFNAFAASPKFLPFFTQLEKVEKSLNFIDSNTDSCYVDPLKLMTEIKVKDYFKTGSPYYAIPEPYPMGTIMANSTNLFMSKLNDDTYLDNFIKELNENEI